MARVVVPGGLVVLMVWRMIDRAPGFAALAAALGRTLGAEGEALMRAPFALGDAGELSELLRAAGLGDVEMRPEAGEVRFASAASFVASYVHGSPLGALVAAAPATAYDALVREVERSLDAFIHDGSLCFPIEAYLARCRA